MLTAIVCGCCCGLALFSDWDGDCQRGSSEDDELSETHFEGCLGNLFEVL